MAPKCIRNNCADDTKHGCGRYPDALAGVGRARLDLPLSITYRVKVETLGDVARRRRVDEVLFVGEHQDRHSHQLLFIQ